jgi:GT2 family glycosyltransferase
MNDSRPLISVCVANYNGMEVINDCLQSVLAQEGRIPVEILVHDDASSDGSAAHLQENYPQVRLIASNGNVGFCVANNRMAAEASGEYLLLLNNDAALYPDALLTLLAEATHLDRPAVLSLAQYNFESGELLDIGSLLDPFLNPIPNQNPDRGEVGMVMGACLWIPKALWQELGGFPEWFESIGEDLHLCCRARLAGYPVRALGRSGYRHRVGASFGGGKAIAGRLVTNYRRRALSERNKTFVMILCYPFWLLVVVLPLHLSILCIEGVVLSALKWNPRPWREIYVPLPAALWQARKKLLILRCEIQEKRNSNTASFLRPFHWLPWKLKMLFKHGLPVIR